MTVALKRVYAKPSPQDGVRVLVDRLWPRGLTKSEAGVDAWFKEIAPSNELRKWFHLHPQERSKFRQRYLKELSADAAQQALLRLYELRSKRKHLTLLFASRNEEFNNATVLKQLLEGGRKPPKGTGPLRAVATKRAQAQRR